MIEIYRNLRFIVSLLAKIIRKQGSGGRAGPRLVPRTSGHDSSG